MKSELFVFEKKKLPKTLENLSEKKIFMYRLASKNYPSQFLKRLKSREKIERKDSENYLSMAPVIKEIAISQKDFTRKMVKNYTLDSWNYPRPSSSTVYNYKNLSKPKNEFLKHKKTKEEKFKILVAGLDTWEKSKLNESKITSHRKTLTYVQSLYNLKQHS